MVFGQVWENLLKIQDHQVAGDHHKEECQDAESAARSSDLIDCGCHLLNRTTLINHTKKSSFSLR